MRVIAIKEGRIDPDYPGALWAEELRRNRCFRVKSIIELAAINLHHFIPKMVDHLHSDTPR